MLSNVSVYGKDRKAGNSIYSTVTVTPLITNSPNRKNL